jgi:Fe2+ transport system protein FeoA
MTLDQAHVGDMVLIKDITDPQAAMVAVRLGISSGEILQLAAKVPGGPLVVMRGDMEIALGRDICRSIEVEKQ